MPRTVGPRLERAVGTTAGFVSTLSHGAVSLVTLYLLQEKLVRHLLVGTQVFYFPLLVNPPRSRPTSRSATSPARRCATPIWFIPLIPAGTLIGAWMNRRIPKPFAAFLYVAAAVTAGHMIWSALR